ncbi:MAG: tRNA 2-thiouridine(34) synthase MnmA [Kiritimatiellae bacterium]|nr:tRNA 2-thiouridine(34) synthase MnmA [Kiritimatiellia bacterium]
MKVGIGLSGGVDSAVSALLLMERGYEVEGWTMALGRDGEEKSIDEAREVASHISIPFHVCDLAESWKTNVRDYIRSTYLSGETPNPCVQCNEFVKFRLLPAAAFAAGCDFFATGHYARLAPGQNGRTMLLRGKDAAKDQSYFLYRVSQDVLKRTIFPLGDLLKSEVRQIALKHGMRVASKGDSQDFCGGSVRDIVLAHDSAEAGCAEEMKGDICDKDGKFLAKHSGFWQFTVGQRKGLGIGGGGIPWYVTHIDAAKNRVVVAHAEDALCKTLSVRDMRWVSVEPTREPLDTLVKIRSAGRFIRARLEEDKAFFEEGVAGIAPGQSAVFYSPDGQTLLCGGIIK